MSAPIETLREALERLAAAAFGQPGKSFASIPARPDADADLLLSSALDELETLRSVPEEAQQLRRILAEERERTAALLEALASLRSELAEVRRERDEAQELAREHYQKAEAAYSRGLDDGAKDAESALAEARKALEGTRRAMAESIEARANRPTEGESR